jgi:magnesium chelatase accessory protein
VAARLALDAGGPARIVAINPALAPFPGAAGTTVPILAKAFAVNPFTPRLLASMADEKPVRRLLDGSGSQLDARGAALHRQLVSRADHVRGTLEMMAGWRLKPLFDALPTFMGRMLMPIGERGRTVPPPPAEAERVTAICPIAEIKILPFGHLPHEEAPELVAALIRGKLAR